MRKKRWNIPHNVSYWHETYSGQVILAKKKNCFLFLQDLFASAVNSNPKSSQAKAATPQPSKAASGSLFSDDEVQEHTEHFNNEHRHLMQ